MTEATVVITHLWPLLTHCFFVHVNVNKTALLYLWGVRNQSLKAFSSL